MRSAPVLGMALLLVAAMMAIASSAKAAGYSVTDLGTLGGPTSEANAINSVGDVTGSADLPFSTPHTSGFVRHPFLLREGVMTDLMAGTVTSEFGRPIGIGNSINDADQVAGAWISGSGDRFAVTWKVGQAMQFVGIGEEPAALGINNAGDIVGTAGSGIGGAWLASGGTTTFLLLSPGVDNQSGSAFAINDLGQAVGEANVSIGRMHAFLYSGGVMHDLGTLGGSSSRATAINELGTVVGSSLTAGDVARHAALYGNNGAITDLGTLGGDSEARGINDSGEIVGSSGGHAFLYHAGAMVDLNTLIPAQSSWTLTTANGINDSHVIVGTGTHNGVQRAFMLTPKGAAAQLADLYAAVQGVGPGKSLAGKIASVQAAVAAGRSSDACGTLTAFINEIKAQTGKKLTAAKAGELTTAAIQIRVVLGCTN